MDKKIKTDIRHNDYDIKKKLIKENKKNEKKEEPKELKNIDDCITTYETNFSVKKGEFYIKFN